MTNPAATLRALMRRVVDYAGLFPPAALSMSDAVARYASHLAAPESWMLGRFVVPVERLGELAEAASPLVGAGTDAWRLSALIGGEPAAAGPLVRAFNAAHRGRFVVDAVECRAVAGGRVAASIGALPGELRIFVEVPLLDDPGRLLEEVRSAGAWAKMRTGGVTAESFPSAREVARFIARAAELSVPFKATAGLHHPICGDHALTYEAGAPTGRMFGFLNVFVATAFAHCRVQERVLVDIVAEDEPAAFRFGDEELRWRGRSVTSRQVASARGGLGLSFGSCSFEEPVAGLRELGLL